MLHIWMLQVTGGLGATRDRVVEESDFSGSGADVPKRIAPEPSSALVSGMPSAGSSKPWIWSCSQTDLLPRQRS